MSRAEATVRDIARRLATASTATWVFRLALVGAVLAYYAVGRQQWFTRDDWASVISRERVLETQGWQHWLFDPQDGHWLTIPFLIFAATRRLFGLDSYWPFLIPTLVAHLGSVCLVRVICLRNRVSPWTTTMVCTLLLVFGSGWENLVFAIQICYLLSLLVFLAQVVLVSHDGPADRRDYMGAGLAVIGMMSSGFGPIFLVGVGVLLALRQRWKPLLIAVVPQGLAYLWWLVTWSSDRAADARPGNQSLLPAFVVRGVSDTFAAMTTLPGLAGIAILATLAVSMQSRHGRPTQTTMLALCATVAVMFSAIGFQRVGFGVEIASSSRYLHMAAMIIAPAFALMIDELHRISREVRLAGLIVVGLSVGANVSILRQQSASWAHAVRIERDTLELIAGSGLGAAADPLRRPFPNSPDVEVRSIPWLVEQGAIVPRVPADVAEVARVRQALGLPPDVAVEPAAPAGG
ncbi:MAG: hypothetical protein ABIR32_21555 [Ilumatobacteraceae bacterium]